MTTFINSAESLPDFIKQEGQNFLSIIAPPEISTDDLTVIMTEENGENIPLFFANQIASMVGYKHPAMAIAAHVPSHNKRTLSSISRSHGAHLDLPKKFLAQPNTMLLTRSGVMHLVAASKTRLGRTFSNWIFDTVLDALFKYGTFSLSSSSKLLKNDLEKLTAENLRLKDQVGILETDFQELRVVQDVTELTLEDTRIRAVPQFVDEKKRPYITLYQVKECPIEEYKEKNVICLYVQRCQLDNIRQQKSRLKKRLDIIEPPILSRVTNNAMCVHNWMKAVFMSEDSDWNYEDGPVYLYGDSKYKFLVVLDPLYLKCFLSVVENLCDRATEVGDGSIDISLYPAIEDAEL